MTHLTAQTYRTHTHGTPVDRLSLDYDDRFLRRKVLTTERGVRVLVDLEQTTSLDHGGVLVTQEGAEILIEAAAQTVLIVRGDNLARLAWHIGNRHTPCQVERDHLLIQNDPVIRHMLEHLEAEIEMAERPFTPEGGAYGHGRTHSHAHGHTAHAS